MSTSLSTAPSAAPPCPDWCHGDHEPGDFHANDGAEVGLRDGGRAWVWMSTEDASGTVRAAVGPEERIAAADELPAMSPAGALRLALALAEHAWMACCIAADDCPPGCTAEHPDTEAAELALNFLELAVGASSMRRHGPATPATRAERALSA